MSVTDVKAKTAKKASVKKPNKAEMAAFQAAIDAAQTEIVPLSDLVKSPLNVRTIPYSVDSVRSLAETIASAGLLQNLIVHYMEDGKSGYVREDLFSQEEGEGTAARVLVERLVQ